MNPDFIRRLWADTPDAINSGRHALIADDSAANLKLATDVLAHVGFTIATAENAPVARFFGGSIEPTQ